ncbi:MAG: ubiquitin-like domain-containing protein [Nakamurella sp.]
MTHSDVPDPTGGSLAPDAVGLDHGGLDTAVLELPEAGPVGAVPTPARSHRRRRILLGLGAAALTVAVVVGGTLVALTRTVTIAVDGAPQSVTTLRGSVAGALTAAGLSVGDHDTVAPALDAATNEGATIVLNRGRLLSLTVDGNQVQLWTTARTVDEAMAELGRDPADYQLSAGRSRAIPVNGLSVTADTLHDVTVDDRGTPRRVSSVSATVADVLTAAGVVLGPNDRVTPGLTDVLSTDSTVTVITLPTVTVTDGTADPAPIVSDQPTVGNLLAAAGITLGAQDTVSVPLDTRLGEGLQVVVTRISTTQVTQAEPIGQPVEQVVDDAALTRGATEVTQQGRAGEASVVYDVVTTNGVETGRTEVSRTVTVEALPTVTHRGTKVPPPVAAPAPVSPPAPAVTAPRAPAVTPPPAVARSTTPAAAPDPAPAAPAPTTPPVTQRSGGTVLFNDFEFGVNWDGLAKCESGNNPRAINPSGKYTGLFQFDDRTWQGTGGSGRAYDAPAEEQLMRAKILFQARGLQPWACAYAAR